MLTEEDHSHDVREDRPSCGLIMPIASMPGYSAEHWAEVMAILSRAIEGAKHTAAPVWAGGAADIIQERIVRNLYEQPIAVCDVSGLNSNVMLELGIRLAFGKPTIIVTDEVLKAPFDINAIEYIAYPQDLHYWKVETFVSRLTERIIEVTEKVEAKEYRPFIKTFGPIDPGSPGTESIPLQQALFDQLEQLSSAVRRMEASTSGLPWGSASSRVGKSRSTTYSSYPPVSTEAETTYFTVDVPREKLPYYLYEMQKISGVTEVDVAGEAENDLATLHVATSTESTIQLSLIETTIRALTGQKPRKF